jgi:glutamine amidotransferase
MRITVIDYGLGNIGSLVNMIRKCGGTSEVVSHVGAIEAAEKIVLPGVGAFDAGISRIDEAGIRDVLRFKALEQRVPFMGICLGMQLLTHGSEEGVLKGLGFVKGRCKRFSLPGDMRVPHMGWNEVSPKKPSRYFDLSENPSRFYFVHSYHVVMKNQEDELLSSDYGTLSVRPLKMTIFAECNSIRRRATGSVRKCSPDFREHDA